MSEPLQDDDGLRETFLVALPVEMRHHLRQIVRGLYSFVALQGLLFSEGDLDPEDAQLVGLWKELGHLARFTGALEREARGSRRFTLGKIRVLLEDARDIAAEEVPPSDR